MNIAIHQIGSLGDTVIALPALWGIRSEFPCSNIIHVSSAKSKGSVSQEDVLEGSGLIDEFIEYNASFNIRDTPKIFNIWNRLRNIGINYVVYIGRRNRSKSVAFRNWVFYKSLGIPNCIGFESPGELPDADGGSLPRVQRESRYFLERLESEGISMPSAGEERTDLNLSDSEIREGAHLIRERGGTLGNSLVCLGVGTKQSAKQWPLERYKRIGKYLIHEIGSTPVIIGGEEDKDVGRKMVDNWGGGYCFAGQLSVRQSASVLSHCDLYVGNDTGVMHLAAAEGVQCVALFSARDWPGRWYPLGDEHVVLRNRVPCEGCLLENCPIGRKCIRKISVKRVKKEVAKFF